MKNIKNRIITISGEPASGKTTVVNAIKKKYENAGYKVHIISVGQVFRELIIQEYKKMYPDKKDINLADIQTDENFASKRGQLDEMIDSQIENKGKEINSVERPNDVYIIDSRLAWKNIPSSFAIRLTINEEIAGQRRFNDKLKGIEDSYEDVEEAIEQTRKRKMGEIERYKERYGVDLTDHNNYNLIIDTSYVDVEELADIIVSGEEAYINNAKYPKTWISPAMLLPLQDGRMTGKPTEKGNTIESIAENIKQSGYKPIEGTVTTIKSNKNLFLLEGNHRALAALASGLTMIPYETIEGPRDTLMITKTSGYDNFLYDWSDGIRYYGGSIGKIESFRDFSIKNIKKIQNLDMCREDQER